MKLVTEKDMLNALKKSLGLVNLRWRIINGNLVFAGEYQEYKNRKMAAVYHPSGYFHLLVEYLPEIDGDRRAIEIDAFGLSVARISSLLEEDQIGDFMISGKVIKIKANFNLNNCFCAYWANTTSCILLNRIF